MTVLVDTGVFFAFYSIKDEHHFDSLGLITHLIKGRWGRAFISNHILDETLNIIKYRLGPEVSKAFLETFIDSNIIDVLYTDAELEMNALKIFRKKLRRKGLSYTDAVTAALIKSHKIDYLLSYDLRSFKGLVENIIGPGYWHTISKEEKKQILEIAKKYARYSYPPK